MSHRLPRLYAILDTAALPTSISLLSYARELGSGGVTLMQYRNKTGSGREMLSDARQLAYLLKADFPEAVLIMNDRPDLCLISGCQGVHLGQDDLPVSAARVLCQPPLLVGVSTHNLPQLEAADATDADYIALGPIYETTSKARPDPVVGLDGLREARKRTQKPLVAIGGITLGNCRSVVDAGADTVAVISALARAPGKSAEAFLQELR